jgi:hypothetical protein
MVVMPRKLTTAAQALKITSVSFRANCAVDGGQKFNHVHIEATAQVDAGKSPAFVLDCLKEFVAEELRIAKGEVRTVVTPGRFRV